MRRRCSRSCGREASVDPRRTSVAHAARGASVSRGSNRRSESPASAWKARAGSTIPCLGAFAEMLARGRLHAAPRQAPRFHARVRQGARVRSAMRLRPDRPRRARARSHAASSRGDRVGAMRGGRRRCSDRCARGARATERASCADTEDWLDEVRAALAYRPAAWDGSASASAGKLHPVEACRPLQRLLDSHPDSVFVCDGGEFGQWAQACLRAPHRVINGVAGSIGSALPFALARTTRPPRGRPSSRSWATARSAFTWRRSTRQFATHCRSSPWSATTRAGTPSTRSSCRRYGPDRLIGCELRPLRYDAVTRGASAATAST